MLELERTTLEKFKDKVLNELGDRVHAIVVYGSLARPVNFTFSEYTSMNFDEAEEAHRGAKFV